MTFNIGYMCKNCGPVRESKKKQINKVPYEVCKECEGIVNKWERPMRERDGRCRCCAGSHFHSRIDDHQLIRICHHCKEEYNTDTDQIVKEGVKDGSL